MHLLPFVLRAQAVLRRHISAFLAGKSHPTLLRGWPGSTGYQIFVISSQPPPPPPPLFATIRHYSRLFATIRTIRTIRDYSLFAIRYSLFLTVRYSLFGFSRHPSGPARWWRSVWMTFMSIPRSRAKSLFVKQIRKKIYNFVFNVNNLPLAGHNRKRFILTARSVRPGRTTATTITKFEQSKMRWFGRDHEHPRENDAS